MALGYTGAGGAAGATAGLQQLLARRMLERKQAEEERQTREQTSIQRWNLGNIEKGRATSAAENLRYHQAAEADRDLARLQTLELGKLVQSGATDRAREAEAGRMERATATQRGLGERAKQNADLQRELRRMGGSSERPYFTMQPLYDPQGRPMAALRMEGRTGKVERVDLPGGGQIARPPGTLGARAVEQLSGMEILSDLEQQFEGGMKDRIGPLAGRVQSLKQKTPGIAGDAPFARFESTSASLRNSVLRAQAGLQQTPSEAERVLEEIPTVKDKPEVWAQKARATRVNWQHLQDQIARKQSPITPPLQPTSRVKRYNPSTGRID